jgi:hypothetical protein
MGSKKQKTHKFRSAPNIFLRPEEEFMTAQAPKIVAAGVESNETESMRRFLARDEGFWCPFRAVSEALLQTQQNSVAYLEANRCLVDMARNIMLKEQDLVFELSETAFSTVCRVGMRLDRSAAIERDEVNEVFNRALTGIRELGEAWIDAQVRSLDVMRVYNKTHARKIDAGAESDADAA